MPIDDAACYSLVANALKDAREKTWELLSKNGSSPGEISLQKAGVTLDLSHHKIANIPLEVIELIKDEIERSAGIQISLVFPPLCSPLCFLPSVSSPPSSPSPFPLFPLPLRLAHLSFVLLRLRLHSSPPNERAPFHCYRSHHPSSLSQANASDNTLRFVSAADLPLRTIS